MCTKKLTYVYFYKIIIFLSMLIICSSSLAQTPRKVLFKKTPQGDLHLYIFDPVNPPNPTSAIIFFFGSGWENGDPSQFFEHCKYFAARGMLAISAEYRVKELHNTTPFESVEDGKSAIRWVRQHAKEFKLNPRQIVAAGGSAGGHVAACTAIIEGFDNEKEDLSVRSKPDAMILFNPVVDTGKDGYGMEKIGDRALEISPVNHITRQTAPTLIFQGTEDTTVSYENVKRFASFMQLAGNNCYVIPFEGYDHGFFNYGQFDNEPYEKTIKLSDDFLAKLGFIRKTKEQMEAEKASANE